MYRRTRNYAVWVPVVILLALLSLAAIGIRRELPIDKQPQVEAKPIKIAIPMREAPKTFGAGVHKPKTGEAAASGSIELGTFSAGRDLIYVNDPRVWWESDSDKNDIEDDHSMHAAMEVPFRRLVELVSETNAVLKVQDAYRAHGVHGPKSLHKEGRALDLTSDELSLEELAKLCWVAGFDWVYHEGNARSGSHVHCSVKRR